MLIQILKSLNLSNWNLSKLIASSNWFFGTFNLDTVDMSNVIFPENSSSFFSGGPGFKAKKLILQNADTSHVTNMSNMFSYVTNIEELDLSSFDTTNVTNMNNMFAGTTNLQNITFGPKFVHKSEASTSGMFNGCPSQDRPTGDTWSGVSFD